MNVHMDIERFFSSIWSMNTDQIAIVSLIITLLLFALGKHSENKLKIYETRKEEYQMSLAQFPSLWVRNGKNVKSSSNPLG